MVRRILASIGMSIILMSILSALSFSKKIYVNAPQVASSFYYTKISHGFPIRYDTVYSNNTGVYGSLVPTASGIHYRALIIDFILWTLLFAIVLVLPKLLFHKKEAPKPSLRSQQRLR